MRVQGSEGVLPLECINPYKDKWRVRWDIQPNTGIDEFGNERTGVNYEEAEFPHRPTLSEIKTVVLAWYNAKIDDKIRSGFVWKEMAVWLSTENQFNYKAAYDLAVQTAGASLPVMFKFGTENVPVYKEFVALEELSDFYTQAMVYVNSVLAGGWLEKDGLDWSVYESQISVSKDSV